MNGCRFVNSVARAGPTRSSAVNHVTFVRKSGPTTANANAAQTSGLRLQSWLPSWPAPMTPRIRAVAGRMIALTRNGE